MRLSIKEQLILRYFIENGHMSTKFIEENFFCHFYSDRFLYKSIKKLKDEKFLKVSSSHLPEQHIAEKLLIPTKKAIDFFKKDDEFHMNNLSSEIDYLKNLNAKELKLTKDKINYGIIRKNLDIARIRFAFELNGAKNFLTKNTGYYLFDSNDYLKPDFIYFLDGSDEFFFSYIFTSKYVDDYNKVKKTYKTILKKKGNCLGFNFILKDSIYNEFINDDWIEKNFKKNLTVTNYKDILNYDFNSLFFTDEEGTFETLEVDLKNLFGKPVKDYDLSELPFYN